MMTHIFSKKFFLLLVGIILLLSLGIAGTILYPSKANTIKKNANVAANYFNQIKNQPKRLYRFLQAMPKGGDLHNHLRGAVYAENLIHFVKDPRYCLNKDNYKGYINNSCPFWLQIANISRKPAIFQATVDTWSLNNFKGSTAQRHQHFFNAFKLFKIPYRDYKAESLASIAALAAMENNRYLEVMINTDNNEPYQLANRFGWHNNIAKLYTQLTQAGIVKIAKKAAKRVQDINTKMHKLLACGTAKSLHGCKVKVRFIYLALREAKPEEVFAQLLTGFEAAKYNPDILGVDLVMPEEGKFSLRDYKLHMSMVSFLHKRYPKVRISLHAGELTPAFAPAKDLQFHIRDAVETADAERIGHGVDIKYETGYKQLLSEMAKKHIMVEINLTSNAQLLDVKGKDHPLPLYIKYGVPVSLSTDDEGVLRTNITEEYVKAEKDFGFSYKRLKSFARNSISYSFLPGKNLWADLNTYKPVSACANAPLGEEKPSETCQTFLAKSEKARQQWQLERNFRNFEQKFVK